MSDNQENKPIVLKARARVSLTQGVLKMLEMATPEFVMDLCQQMLYENMTRMPDSELINTFKAMEAELERQQPKQELSEQTESCNGQTDPVASDEEYKA